MADKRAAVSGSSVLKTSKGDEVATKKFSLTAGQATGYFSAATSAVGAITGAISAGYRSEMIREMGAAERERREFNSKLLEMQAEDVMSAAGEQAADYMLAVGGVLGAQRAGYAAQGVKVSGGVPARLRTETRATARQTLARLMNKARLEASGIRTQASFQRMAGRQTAEEARAYSHATVSWQLAKGTGTLLSSAYKIADTSQAFSEDATGINAYRKKVE